ncbi:MAG: hypothetical protein R2784_11275 [Saprospiraceae bacterium]
MEEITTSNIAPSPATRVDAPAVSLSNGVCYDPPFCDNINAFRLKADFQNSIIFGSRNDELSLVDYEFNNAGFDYNFENCIVKVRELLDPPDKEGSLISSRIVFLASMQPARTSFLKIQVKMIIT